MAVNYNPKLTDAYIRIGNIFASNGNYKEALNKYSKAQQAQPDSPYIWLKIADTLIKLDRIEEALHAYDMAINCTTSFNNSTNLRNEKINLLFRLRLPHDVIKSEVIKEHDYIIQLSPDPIDACYQKIKFVIDHGWYPEAFEAYDQLIQLKPNDIGILYQKAALQEKLGYVNQALVSYDQIIELVPGAINARDKNLTYF